MHANSHAISCIELALSNKIGQMAIAIALLGFNDLGYLVTPIDGLFSLQIFYI